jgi:hypothetical protein
MTDTLTPADLERLECSLAQAQPAIGASMAVWTADMRKLLAAARRGVEAHAALALLLAAKHEKDAHGKTERYERLRVEGWARAEEVHKEWPAPPAGRESST